MRRLLCVCFIFLFCHTFSISQNTNKRYDEVALLDSISEYVLAQKKFELFGNTIRLLDEVEFATCDPLAVEMAVYKVYKAFFVDWIKDNYDELPVGDIPAPQLKIDASLYASVKDSLLTISVGDYGKYIGLRKNFNNETLLSYNNKNPESPLDVRRGVFVANDSINNTRTTYKGMFINNTCDGEAHCIYKDDKNGTEIKYMGYYAYGGLYGRGQEVVKSGGMYQILYNGDFVNNKKIGNGNLLLIGKNSEDFSVEYNGFRFYSVDKVLNVRMEGVFENDLFVEGTLTTTSGNMFAGKFRDGVLVDGEHKANSGKNDVEPVHQFVATDFQDNKETVYTEVDQKPEFPGGVSALQEYLRNNIRYPKSSLDKKSQGRAIVGFVVNIDGSVTDAEIMRGSGDLDLDAEAVRVVLQMPNWYPAKHRGEQVCCYYVLPIVFRLQ